jgi:hypothetical protein
LFSNQDRMPDAFDDGRQQEWEVKNGSVSLRALDGAVQNHRLRNIRQNIPGRPLPEYRTRIHVDNALPRERRA